MSAVATKEPARVPLWRWAAWMTTLGVALFVFYVLSTPVWIGLRVLAVVADRRARRSSDRA